MKSGIAFVETKFVPLNKAFAPVTDLAFQRGTGLFETLRTYNRYPFTLGERLKRLKKSAESLGLKLDYSLEFIKTKVFQGIEQLRAREVLVKIIITGGDSQSLTLAGKSRLVILFLPFVPWPEQFYQKGIKVVTTKIGRMLPTLKSLSYLSAVAAHQLARLEGYDEALYVDEKNQILEGTTFNFAIIKKEQIVTPDEGILEGITMDIVLRLARRLSLKILRRPIKYQELKTVEEALVTSASREVIPVVKIDKIKIGGGLPGPWAKLLLENYRHYARNQKN